MRLIAALVLSLILLGCMHHVKAAPMYPGPIVDRTDYAYRALGPNQYGVIANDGEALQRAKLEIGCGICTEEPILARIVTVNSERKKK